MINPNEMDIKPWYKNDIANTLAGIYFASVQNKRNEDYRAGFAAALSSVALAVGVKPESFLSPGDVQLIRRGQA